MPVFTRSQITDSQPQNEQRIRQRTDQEDTQMARNLRNPHHGLKEKMKALTLLYEQQKQGSAAIKNQSFKPEDSRLSSHPSVDLVSSGRRAEKEQKQSKTISLVMRENTMHSSTVTRTYVQPPPPSGLDDGKENVAVVAGGDRIVGFSYPKRVNPSSNVARKLSLGSSTMPHTEPRAARRIVKENVQELDSISEKAASKGGGVDDGGSRILVFVRLRPISRKEREAGARCCVKIVDGRDVYLTEFATENDYLRLKRLRGRHFTFDASFPDTATQHDVYSTT